eukprot:277669-Rhodomonas_salina.1
MACIRLALTMIRWAKASMVDAYTTPPSLSSPLRQIDVLHSSLVIPPLFPPRLFLSPDRAAPTAPNARRGG